MALDVTFIHDQTVGYGSNFRPVQLANRTQISVFLVRAFGQPWATSTFANLKQ